MTAVALIYGGFVLLVSLAPLMTGNAIRGQGGRARLAWTASYGLLGLALGVLLCIERAPGVSVARGVEAGALAGGLLVVLPVALYLQLGYRVRPLWLACGVWFASLLPLLMYLLVVSLWIASDVNCPPGENCSPFS